MYFDPCKNDYICQSTGDIACLEESPYKYMRIKYRYIDTICIYRYQGKVHSPPTELDV